MLYRFRGIRSERRQRSGREHGEGGCRRTVGSNPVIQRWGDVQRQSVRESNLELTNTVVLVSYGVYGVYAEHAEHALGTTVTLRYC